MPIEARGVSTRISVDWFDQILDTRVRDRDYAVTGRFVFVPANLAGFNLPETIEPRPLSSEHLRELLEWLVDDEIDDDYESIDLLVERFATEPIVALRESPISGKSLDEIVVDAVENADRIALLALVEFDDTSALVIKCAAGIVLAGFAKAFSKWVDKACERILSGFLPWVPAGQVRKKGRKPVKSRSGTTKPTAGKKKAAKKLVKKAPKKRTPKKKEL